MSSKTNRRIWQEKPFIILVDMDGVMCDFEGHLLTMFRKQHPEAPYIPLENRNTFYTYDQYFNEFGEDIAANIRKIISSPGFYRDLPPLPGAIEGIKDLSRLDNAEVFICTSQSIYQNLSASDKLGWIEEHLGPDWKRRVILSQDKTLVNGDILIDDKPVIKGVIKKPSWKQIFFGYCNNNWADPTRLRNIGKVDGWKEKEKLLDMIDQVRRGLL